MRVYLESLGCDFLFGKRLDGLKSDTSSAHRFKLNFSDNTSLETDHLFGHRSLGSRYHEHLVDAGLAMSPKPFAIGALLSTSGTD